MNDTNLIQEAQWTPNKWNFKNSQKYTFTVFKNKKGEKILGKEGAEKWYLICRRTILISINLSKTLRPDESEIISL